MELFRDNYFFIYIWICLSIFNYSEFSDNQKIIVLYFINFGIGFLKIYSGLATLVLLFISTFIFLEIFTKDTDKMIIFTKIRYKIIDYLFIVFFQYNIIYIIFAILLTSTKIKGFFAHILPISPQYIYFFLSAFSIIFFFRGITKITQENFKIATVTQLRKNFTPSINKINFEDIDQNIFNMLIEMEDNTYFNRKKSYTFISKKFFEPKLKGKNLKQITQYINKNNLVRGFSTLEMQLIRTIGIVYGYGTLKYSDKEINRKNILTVSFYRRWGAVVRRKIFELVYATVFFTSLKMFYEKNVYVNSGKYKEYILYIYLNYAPTRIKTKKFDKITDFIDHDPKKWTKEKCFIAYAGLPYVGAKESLDAEELEIKYNSIIYEYQLDMERIISILNFIK